MFWSKKRLLLERIEKLEEIVLGLEISMIEVSIEISKLKKQKVVEDSWY